MKSSWLVIAAGFILAIFYIPRSEPPAVPVVVTRQPYTYYPPQAPEQRTEPQADKPAPVTSGIPESDAKPIETERPDAKRPIEPGDQGQGPTGTPSNQAGRDPTPVAQVIDPPPAHDPPSPPPNASPVPLSSPQTEPTPVEQATNRPPSSKTVPQVKADRMSVISNKVGDPHQCGPAPYYANFGPETPHPAGYGGLTNPKFLFAAQDYNAVNWTHGFTGTIQVCLIIDEQGNPKDIRVLQSPGRDFAEHVTAILSGWRFSPGRFKANFRQPAGQPVPVMVEYDLTFK